MVDINFPNENFTIVHREIQALIFRIKPTTFKELKISNEMLMQRHNLSMKGQSQHSMRFPPTLLQSAKSPPEEMRLICIYLKRSCLFQDGKNSSLLNDDILGATLGNTRVTNLSEPVEIRFWHNYTLDNSSVTCVFWEAGAETDGQGNWSHEGCHTISQEGMVLCQCNHLTYFAILLQTAPIAVEEALLAPLTYLTIIGCSISSLACLITIFLYIFSRKKLHDSTTKIHMNLLGALFFLNAAFLVSEPQASVKAWMCAATAVFLHYSLLCSLTWMAIEGFHLYMLVIRVYRSYISRYLLKLCSVGWGLPGLAVMIILLINRDVYGTHAVYSSSSYRNSTMCWITHPYRIVHTLNLIYFGGIILFNMTILIMVVQRLRKLRANPQQQERNSLKDAMTVLGLMCLLGAAWALAFTSFGVFTIPQIFLFTVLNSLQGKYLKMELLPDVSMTAASHLMLREATGHLSSHEKDALRGSRM
ncbi:hypothetical protein lerEdw1_001094 [Lerista edwardsae]|nr:hypothetical protein lerEdw1_001094 [Lerista edwardsae]